MEYNNTLPRHIAIIMDGNGRWAKKRGLPRKMGHAAGAETFRRIATYCKNLGVEYLTVYAFSTENWKRSADEVQAIMALFEKYLHEAIDEMERDHIRLKILGELGPISPELRALIERTDEISTHYQGFQANVCINYGGRDEIIHAARRFAADCVNGVKKPEELTEADFAHYLYTDGIPDPELIIRPSGELRTQDETRSVIRVGSEIARILEDAGIETLHDTTANDYPSYNGSYARMEAIIESYLAEYPSIQMVLDVHRDAVEDQAGFPAALSCKLDGEDYARLMLVVGTDEGGLEHPGWQENLANALKLQALLNRTAPGLCRDLDLRTERFNQHETKGSLLCEFGASGNTLSQALRTARLFADTLVTFINGVKQTP
mgnify:CR=1 FL=1